MLSTDVFVPMNSVDDRNTLYVMVRIKQIRNEKVRLIFSIIPPARYHESPAPVTSLTPGPAITRTPRPGA